MASGHHHRGIRALRPLRRYVYRPAGNHRPGLGATDQPPVSGDGFPFRGAAAHSDHGGVRLHPVRTDTVRDRGWRYFPEARTVNHGPVPRRPGQGSGGRQCAVRQHLRQRRRQCRQHRRDHHTADEAHRLQSDLCRRGRGSRLDRRGHHAACHGRGRLRDDRVPGHFLRLRGARSHCSRSDLLRHASGPDRYSRDEETRK